MQGVLNLIMPILGGTGAGVISWITSVHPLIWFFSIFVGLAIGLFFSNEIVARRLRKQTLTPGGSKADVSQTQYDEDWSKNLTRLFTSEITQINFARLWDNKGEPSTEPFFTIHLKFTNNTPFTINITGIEGSMKINNEECTQSIKSRHTNLMCPKWDHGALTITQPLLTEKGKTLIRQINKGEEVPFHMGIYFTGEVGGQESKLPRIRAAEDFGVDTSGINERQAVVNPQPPIFKR